jgi:hypothetical protein
MQELLDTQPAARKQAALARATELKSVSTTMRS